MQVFFLNIHQGAYPKEKKKQTYAMIHQSDLDCLHVLTKNWPFVFSFNFFLILKNLLIQ